MVSQRAEDRTSGELVNETVVNVATMLRDELGARRSYTIRFDEFPLADDLVAYRLSGGVNLTRLREQVLASVDITGEALMECVRCLRKYEQPFRATFDEPFRQSVDVQSGHELRGSRQVDLDEDDAFEIDEHHQIDLREAIRQNVLLELPMRPDCGDECPGPDLLADSDGMADDDAPADDRFAALSALLETRDDRGN
ncbi:MAG TPA: DUF177 domain-containing protein [Thermomicrobiales bacterium]|jgi:uncharacterized protein|nr:DUF177 domain-containing protein [Thermomicrobiales bacterium]